MGDFPDISRPQYSECSQKKMKLQEISSFEGGTRQSRPVHTLGKIQFKIGWGSDNGLPVSEYETLEDHFESNVGSTFSWIHWNGVTTYTVRYIQNELPEAKVSACGNYMILTGLILEEA